MLPAYIAKSCLLPMLRMPVPKEKDGINLKIHCKTTPASLVDLMILKMNIATVKIAPKMKLRKKHAT